MFRCLVDLLIPPRRDPYPDATDIREAEDRWRALNQAAKEAGCKCGEPATDVRLMGGNLGSVPVEVWSCEKHVNVARWGRFVGQEHHVPIEE